MIGSGGYIVAGGWWWQIYFGWWWKVVDGGGSWWVVVGGGTVQSNPSRSPKELCCSFLPTFNVCFFVHVKQEGSVTKGNEQNIVRDDAKAMDNKRNEKR